MCSSEDLRDTNDVAKFAVPPMMTATLAAQASFSPVSYTHLTLPTNREV